MEETQTQSAVALRYDPESGDDSPRVVATGQGHLAAQILRVAQEHDIPLRQDPALVQALSGLDVGSAIPAELFRAVAEILAFVYRLNGKE